MDGSEKSLCVPGHSGASFGAELVYLVIALVPFRHSVLGQLPWQRQAQGRLHLAGRDGSALVVMRQAGSLAGDVLKDIFDERVHDAHGLR